MEEERVCGKGDAPAQEIIGTVAGPEHEEGMPKGAELVTADIDRSPRQESSAGVSMGIPEFVRGVKHYVETSLREGLNGFSDKTITSVVLTFPKTDYGISYMALSIYNFTKTGRPVVHDYDLTFAYGQYATGKKSFDDICEELTEHMCKEMKRYDGRLIVKGSLLLADRQEQTLLMEPALLRTDTAERYDIPHMDAGAGISIVCEYEQWMEGPIYCGPCTLTKDMYEYFGLRPTKETIYEVIVERVKKHPLILNDANGWMGMRPDGWRHEESSRVYDEIFVVTDDEDRDVPLFYPGVMKEVSEELGAEEYFVSTNGNMPTQVVINRSVMDYVFRRCGCRCDGFYHYDARTNSLISLREYLNRKKR